jgi:osmoprotectant transport system permease protein
VDEEGDVTPLAGVFSFVGDHSALVGQSVLQTLELFGAAFGIALAVSLPIGVALGHVHRGSLVAINVGNVGRALPSLAVISILIALVGIGFLNVVVALAILAIPVIVTNSYVAVAGVEPDVVEAARGIGMRPLQVLWRVELPLAVALIFAGIRTAAVIVMATTPLAAVAGGNGLGQIIVNQPSYGLDGVIAASLIITALSFMAELAFAGLQRLLTPRGLRREEETPAIGPALTT